MDGYNGDVVFGESGIVWAKCLSGVFDVVLVVAGADAVVSEGWDKAVEALGRLEFVKELVELRRNLTLRNETAAVSMPSGELSINPSPPKRRRNAENLA